MLDRQKDVATLDWKRRRNIREEDLETVFEGKGTLKDIQDTHAPFYPK